MPASAEHAAQAVRTSWPIASERPELLSEQHASPRLDVIDQLQHPASSANRRPWGSACPRCTAQLRPARREGCPCMYVAGDAWVACRHVLLASALQRFQDRAYRWPAIANRPNAVTAATPSRPSWTAAGWSPASAFAWQAPRPPTNAGFPPKTRLRRPRSESDGTPCEPRTGPCASIGQKRARTGHPGQPPDCRRGAGL